MVMKSIFLLAVTFVVMLLLPVFSNGENVRAQAGTFTCEYGTVEDDWCTVKPGSTCTIPPGRDSHEQKYCAQFDGNPAGCTGSRGNGYCQTCQAPSQCLPNSCPSTHVSSPGRCASPSDACCIVNNISPPPPQNCFKCNIEPMGGNSCIPVPKNAQGTCAPYDDDIINCNTACRAPVFTQLTCDRSGAPQCIPAPHGEFSGTNAYTDCLAVCQRPLHPALCPDQMSVNTAIGCIPVLSNIVNFASFTLGWSTGIAGGIAFLLIVVAGFYIMTSRGDIKKSAAGKELLGAVLAGILFLVFAAFILRIVGSDILQIF
jgi:hypothetical protein